MYVCMIKVNDSFGNQHCHNLAHKTMLQLTITMLQHIVCSGKAFSKLMKKRKGLLRIDLRDNTLGMSGVLQMMTKGSMKAATALSLADSAVLGDAQQMPQNALANMPSKGFLSGANASHENGASPHAFAVDDQPHRGSGAGVVSSEGVEKQEGAGTIVSQKATRRGLVPMFIPEGQQNHTETGKENQPTGKEVTADSTVTGKRQTADSKGRRAPSKAKPAGKGQAGAKHARQHSAACTAGFEFQKLGRLQSQPTAHLRCLVPAAVASKSNRLQDEAAAASLNQQYQTDHKQDLSSALQNATVGSATFADWNNKSLELDAEELSLSESVLPGSSATLIVERPQTAGIAGSARRTVSFQEQHLTGSTNHNRGQQGNAVNLASDPAYIQGMSQAWREVEEAEDLGRQRAAADFDYTLHQLSAPRAAYYAPESAGSRPLYEARQAAATSPAADLTRAGADRMQQCQRPPPSSACPGLTRSVKQRGAAAQQGMSHSRAGFRAASMPDKAVLGTQATPPEDTSADDSADSSSAAAHEGGSVSACVSGLPDQAAAAAAAMEAAKMKVRHAEVMCELEGLKCSLEGAAAERRRYVSTSFPGPSHGCSTSLQTLQTATTDTGDHACNGVHSSMKHDATRAIFVQWVSTGYHVAPQATEEQPLVV